MRGLTVAQAAELCGVQPVTVRGWINRGRIVRGARGLIDPDVLLKWWDQERKKKMVRSGCKPP